MPTAEQMPEGTDQIIEGAGTADEADEAEAAGNNDPDERERPETAYAANEDEPPSASKPEAGTGGDVPFTPAAMFERFDQIKAQGYDRARELAQSGLDRTVDAVEDVVRMINDAADQIDDKVGAQYGDYARKAADSVGSLSELLKGKDVDDLFADAREIVKKSPGVAIGAAAALGFVVARLARAGLSEAPVGKAGDHKAA